MADIFLKIVNMSISASWLILAVLVVRLIFRKAPKWIHVLLWGTVAVRLLCPFSIESAWSLIPSAETISPEIMMEATSKIQTGISAVNSAANPIVGEDFAPKPVARVNPLQIWIPVLAVVWSTGAVVLFTYTAISYRRLRRKVGTAILLRDNIFQSENVNTPFVLGVIKPRIYLPFRMGEQNLEHVVSHEQAHIRRRDHWWKPLAFFLLTIHWFNPLMWLAYVIFCRDIELACDEKVIKKLGNDQRADYSQALLTCSIKRRMITACPLAFGEVGVKERVKSVLNYKKPAFWVMPASVVVCVTIAICFLTNPKESENKLADTNPITSGETISWTYTPDDIAWNTALHFNFRLEYTHIEASCDEGMLWDLYSEGKTKGQSLRFESGHSVCWTPAGDAFANFPEKAKVTFTIYRGERELHSGEFALTRTDDDDDNVVEYEAQQIADNGLLLLKTGGNFGGMITPNDYDEAACNHIPGTYISTKWEKIPNLDPAKYGIIELKWDAYTCAYCGVPFDYYTATYRVRQSGNQWSGHPLSPSDFDDPVATAEILLSRAFSFKPSGYKSTVSQNGDFWNITFDGEYHYTVEISKKLPYPQTVYQYREVPTEGYDEVQIPIEGELVDIAEYFLFSVYGHTRDNAQNIDVFQYENKICVQFVISDTEIFHVRIHTGDLKPSGILFFNNIETAQRAMETAGAVEVHS